MRLPPRLHAQRQLRFLKIIAGLYERRLGLVVRRLGRAIGFRIGVDFPVGRIGAAQRGDQAIVILLRNRIVLVFMAAGTAERQAKHRGAERGHHVVEMVVADEGQRLGSGLAGVRTRDQKTRGRDRLKIVGDQMITRDLHADELVERHILVERPDHEIAIVIGGRAIAVELIAAALGKTGCVEPVPRPALAEVFALQEAIDQFVICIRRSVAYKRLDLGRRRRQAVQVEVGAANKTLSANRRVGR